MTKAADEFIAVVVIIILCILFIIYICMLLWSFTKSYKHTGWVKPRNPLTHLSNTVSKPLSMHRFSLNFKVIQTRAGGYIPYSTIKYVDAQPNEDGALKVWELK